MNTDLQNRLTEVFRPLGIVAFTNCCRIGCTDTYEDDDTFKFRETKGIFFIRLHLDGMNYNPRPTQVWAQYEDFDYLMTHWDEECDLIKKWAKIVNVDVEIQKPKSVKETIRIKFAKELELDD